MPGTVGGLTGAARNINLTVNREDGFQSVFRSDVYELDIQTHTLTVNQTQQHNVSCGQIDRMAAAIDTAMWKTNAECPHRVAIDGGPVAPKLAMSGAAGAHTFGFSDADCALSDHSAFGDVVGCSVFGIVYDVIADIAPDQPPTECQDYW